MIFVYYTLYGFEENGLRKGRQDEGELTNTFKSILLLVSALTLYTCSRNGAANAMKQGRNVHGIQSPGCMFRPYNIKDVATLGGMQFSDKLFLIRFIDKILSIEVSL